MSDHHMTPTEYTEYCRLVAEAMALDDRIKAIQSKQAQLLAKSGEIVERSLVRAGDPAAIRRALGAQDAVLTTKNVYPR